MQTENWPMGLVTRKSAVTLVRVSEEGQRQEPEGSGAPEEEEEKGKQREIFRGIWG